MCVRFCVFREHSHSGSSVSLIIGLKKDLVDLTSEDEREGDHSSSGGVADAAVAAPPRAGRAPGQGLGAQEAEEDGRDEASP